MITVLDARSGKRVKVGDTIKYPRLCVREDGSTYEGSDDSWTLVDLHDHGWEGVFAIVRKADGRLHETELRVRGQWWPRWWPFRVAIVPT